MKNRHLTWVPHFLDDDLRTKRLEGAQQLLDVLQAQERCHFRDLITGDETWVYFDMKLETVWLPAGAELPAGVKRTIASEKRMVLVSKPAQPFRSLISPTSALSINLPFVRHPFLSLLTSLPLFKPPFSCGLPSMAHNTNRMSSECPCAIILGSHFSLSQFHEAYQFVRLEMASFKFLF
jgi:hypothetical protein